MEFAAICLVSSILTVIKGLGSEHLATRLGNITGVRRNVLGSDLYEFRTIPYAKPPVGALRFEKPHQYGAWDGTLDGTKFAPACFQEENIRFTYLVNKNVSEDCLFLNIYVPSTNRSKAVLVWIHGGSYAVGQASGYDGSQLAIVGDIIVVTINYRLNIFGFLNLDNAFGNYGLWDQRMAIQWVKDNIADFGGNSNAITISGESAGGFSVGLHTIAPINKGLFQRAIMQSGSALSYYAIGKYTKKLSTRATSLVNCSDIESSMRLIKCMKSIPAYDLFNAYKTLRSETFWQIAFAPVVDGEFITKSPLKLLKDKSSEASIFYRSLDILVGTVSGESSLLVMMLTAFDEVLGFNITEGIPKNVLSNFLAPQIANESFKTNSLVLEAIIKKYGQSFDHKQQTINALNVYSDLLFDAPAVQSLQLHAIHGTDNARRFQYVFSRESPYQLFGILPPWFTLSEHGAEVIFQFGNALLNISNADLDLSTHVKKYWTNFVRTGNVNGVGLQEWKEYDLSRKYYANLDLNITLEQKLHEDRMQFWLTDIPAILDSESSAYHNCRPVVSFIVGALMFFAFNVL